MFHVKIKNSPCYISSRYCHVPCRWKLRTVGALKRKYADYSCVTHATCVKLNGGKSGLSNFMD